MSKALIMNNKLKALAIAIQPVGLAAVITASCLSGHQSFALDTLKPNYSFNGFSTLSAIYSDEDQADFVSSWLLQPNGAGHTSQWHAGVDTKLGGQVNAQFNERLSAVLQVVVERQEDNAWAPAIEWANIRYRLNDNVSLRLGRTVLATFMVSDTRLVGYANPWIRGPQELYQIVPITNIDGVDVIYTRDFGDWRNTLQMTFGQTNQDLISDGELRARNSFLLSNSLEYDYATFRLAYLTAHLDLDTPESNALINAYNYLSDTLALTSGLEEAAAQASTIPGRYALIDAPIEVYSAGLRLEPNNWLFIAEWALVTEANALSKAEAWYATLGYRLDSVTPYLTLAEVNGDTPREPGVSTSGMPLPLATTTNAMNTGLNQFLSGASHAQKSITLGIRWDFISNAALKLQYQHIDFDEKSAGRLANVQPNFEPGNRVNTFSAAIDFVF
jgi:hypothetical protein